jgi:hypothetical protein
MNIKVRKSRLRVINNGTRYDVAGKLKWLARQIESGKLGDVRDVVVGVAHIGNGGGMTASAYHYGTGNIAAAHHLLKCVENEMT